MQILPRLPRLRALLGCLTALIIAAPSGVASSPNEPLPRMPIGMNLSGISDWGPGFPFKNLMWGARLWMTANVRGPGPWDTEKLMQIPLDENGYPLELPFTVPDLDVPQVVRTILPNRMTPGEYVLLYDGEGDFRGLQGTSIVSQSPGRVVLRMTHGKHLEGFYITRSVRGNHVRNVRILALADEHADLAANPFRDDFIEFCRPFHNIRYMNWSTTNFSLERDWERRKKPTFYTMRGLGGDADKFWRGVPDAHFLLSGGVAWEVIIDLANKLKIDPWINVPHRATDDYIRQMAVLFRDRLDPSLKIHLEYSNEVWNWAFVQSHWMLLNRFAADFVKARGVEPWERPPTDDEGEIARGAKGRAHPERMAALSVRTFRIWEEVFGDTYPQRLVRIVGVQAGWPDTGRRTLRMVMENGGADAVSPAGYFGPDREIFDRWDAAGANLTVDQVAADMLGALENKTAPWARFYGDLARQHNVRLIIYEGGQHIQPREQKEAPYMPALAAIQSHPVMYDLYIRNFRIHQEVGTHLFVAYSSITDQGNRIGSFGHLSDYNQPLSEAPKMRALLDVNLPRPVRP